MDANTNRLPAALDVTDLIVYNCKQHDSNCRKNGDLCRFAVESSDDRKSVRSCTVGNPHIMPDSVVCFVVA